MARLVSSLSVPGAIPMRMTRDGIGVTAEQVFEIGLALPGVQRRDSGEYVSLRVSDKGFAYFSPDGARFR